MHRVCGVIVLGLALIATSHAQRRPSVQDKLKKQAPDFAAKFNGGDVECPAIPVPISEVIIQVDVCLEPMGRELRDRELKAVVEQLEDCGQASILLFMMNACADAQYLDKTVDCVFENQDKIMTKLKLTEFEVNVAKKLFVCARKLHEDLKSKRKT